MKKFKASTYQKKLDALWSECVRKRDKFCQVCGKTENLQAHHWLVRKARSLQTRWDVRNGITLCYSCHICKLHGHSGDAIFLRSFLSKCDLMFDKGIQEELELKAKSSDIRATLFFLEQIKKDLNDYYASIN